MVAVDPVPTGWVVVVVLLVVDPTAPVAGVLGGSVTMASGTVICVVVVGSPDDSTAAPATSTGLESEPARRPVRSTSATMTTRPMIARNAKELIS